MVAINAENAAHKSEKFVAMATRTRHEYLKDLANNYVTNSTIEANSKFYSKLSFGSSKKRDRPKSKNIIDNTISGALVWEILWNDANKPEKLKCYLAISATVLSIITKTNSQVIFVIPTSLITGWSEQDNW